MSNTEENRALFHLRDIWYGEAKEQTLDTLPAFLDKLAHHPNDYNTICYALAAGAIATATALDRGAKGGGITGFQGSAIMWEFIHRWGHIDGPAKLLNYENMLWPQYEQRFEKTISKETFFFLRNKAEEHLKNRSLMMHEAVAAHLESIVNGQIPFGFTIEEDGED